MYPIWLVGWAGEMLGGEGIPGRRKHRRTGMSNRSELGQSSQDVFEGLTI